MGAQSMDLVPTGDDVIMLSRLSRVTGDWLNCMAVRHFHEYDVYRLQEGNWVGFITYH